MKKWKDLTDAEKCARLTAGRREPIDGERDAETEPDCVREERAKLWLDLNQCCEAREIQ